MRSSAEARSLRAPTPTYHRLSASCFIDTTRGEFSHRLAIVAAVLLCTSILAVMVFGVPVLFKIYRTNRALDRVMSIKVNGGKLVFAHSDVNRAALKMTVYGLVYSVKASTC